MKIRLLCEIKADIVDKKELESIEHEVGNSNTLRGVERFWTKILKKKLEDVWPNPIYDNKEINIKVEYYEKEMEKQEFQVGDMIYCIDEDYREFEDIVVSVELERDRTICYTGDNGWDFFKEDIGKEIFRTREERSKFLSRP